MGPSSWISNVLKPVDSWWRFITCQRHLADSIHDDDDVLGDIWDSVTMTADKARICSINNVKSGSNSLRVVFCNATPLSLILCWVDEQSIPHHFYPFSPPPSAPSLLVSSSSSSSSSQEENKIIPKNNVLTKSVMDWPHIHLENTRLNHAFVLLTKKPAAENQIEKDKTKNGGGGCDSDKTESSLEDLHPSRILAGYRPTRLGVKDEDKCIHLVTLRRRPKEEKKHLRENNDKNMNDEEFEYYLTVDLAKVDPKPLDTSDKVYEREVLGGWPVLLEPGCLSDNNVNAKTNARDHLTADFEYVCKCLPPKICAKLQKTAPFYINKSQKWGSEACPTSGSGLCFHADRNWLIENGMSPLKHKCLEMYSVSHYLRNDWHFWGTGGVLLHELAHAYHYQYLKDGFDHKGVLKCYRNAMKKGLYDCVAYHRDTWRYHDQNNSNDNDNDMNGDDSKKNDNNGSKHHGKTRAYACMNQMEYFAELSAAYLGGLNDSKEFNKWFPFNRQQIKEHDPEAYAMLQEIWNDDSDEDENEDE